MYRGKKRKIKNTVLKVQGGLGLGFMRITSHVTSSFQFIQILILLMVQATNNAANRRRTTKVNAISYWLSLAQLKTNTAFFIALGMHSLSHKSLFHGTYFGFVSLIPKTNPWYVVSDAHKRQNRKTWYQRARYVFFSYLYDKLNNAFQDGSFILSENNLPVV